MEVRAVLYDLDGTLIDSFPGIESASRRAWEEVLPGRAFPDMRAAIGPPIRKTFELLGAVEESHLLEAAFRKAYDGGCFKESTLFEGVRETLMHFSERGVRQWVVTNKPSAPANLILSELGVASLFREIVSPDSRAPRFASKGEALAATLAAHGLKGEGVFYVGDTEEDLAAAEYAGIAFLGVPHGYGRVGLEAKGAEILREFNELRALRPGKLE